VNGSLISSDDLYNVTTFPAGLQKNVIKDLQILKSGAASSKLVWCLLQATLYLIKNTPVNMQLRAYQAAGVFGMSRATRTSELTLH
jgi:hypothetical protein